MTRQDAPASAAGIPSTERQRAERTIVSYFYIDGPAQQREGSASNDGSQTAGKHYCRACLESEMIQVQRAREQFGQGTNASIEVLRGIAISRLVFSTLPVLNLLSHLLACQNIPADTRSTLKKLKHLLQPPRSAVSTNRFDYGSIYEATLFPQQAGSDKSRLEPGSADPAHLYAAQEQGLLKRALRRQREARSYKRRAAAKLAKNLDTVEDPSTSDDDDFADSDQGDTVSPLAAAEHVDPAAALVPSQPATEHALAEPDQPVDLTVLFDPDAVHDSGASTPSDFPSSDLLKSLSTYTAGLYAAQGLLSTASKPVDGEGIAIPSMLQALDGSALIAMGILTQELVKDQLNIPRLEQDIGRAPSHLFRRTPGQRGLGSHFSKEDKEEAYALLRNVPSGSEQGIRHIIRPPKP